MKVSIYDMKINEKRLPYLYSVRDTDITDEEMLNSPEKIAEIIWKIFDAQCLLEERVWMLSFDGRYHLIGIFEICRGTAEAIYISPVQILQRALLSGAVSVALAHVHPSGDVTASDEDKTFTQCLKQALEVCRIKFVDHIIVSGANRRSFFSFKEGQLL